MEESLLALDPDSIEEIDITYMIHMIKEHFRSKPYLVRKLRNPPPVKTDPPITIAIEELEKFT